MSVLHLLWLPILLSAVFVFVASALIHMILFFWHKSDYSKLPEEDKIMDALRPFAIPPGDYMIPNCSGSAEMKTAAFQEKLKKGPVLMATVMPNGMYSVGRSLVLWFIYVLVVSYFAAYVTAHALPVWTGHRNICRFAGISAFLAYTGALWQMSIWYRRSWCTTIKTTIDGLIYAGITAATFGWLWPR
jgi:hypothetical protein